MDEQLQEKIVSIVDALQRECPEVINELLWWHAVSNLFWIAVSLAIVVTYCFYSKRLWRLCKEVWAKEENATANDIIKAGVIAVSTAACASAVLTVLDMGSVVAQILITPRVFLLEYMADLLTN